MAADVFISYSSRDRDRVTPIVKELEAHGISVWFDQEGIEGADLWRSEIVNGIEGCKVLVLMGSASAVASENVVKEVSLASEKKKRILPVYLEPVEIPATLEYQLAGVHHIAFHQGDPKVNLHRILRSLHRVGVTIKDIEQIEDIPWIELPKQQEDRARIEKFQAKHHTGLVTLLFTDIAGLAEIKSKLGGMAGYEVIQKHHRLVREILSGYPDGEEIKAVGDSFFNAFVRPSDAVRFSLILQMKLRELSQEVGVPIRVRIGIHIGEVFIEKGQGTDGVSDLYGTQVDTCARVMSLCQGGQILVTRSTFDNAREVLKGEEIEGVKGVSWLNHGNYHIKGLDDAVEVCEVGETEFSPLTAPENSDEAKRLFSPAEEEVLGWRPAIGQGIPQSHWKLIEKLGESGFGEVWVGEHEKLKEKRVFKFCFKADRVRSLKREVTLFRLLKDKVGEHPNIARIYEVYFDEAPFYVVMDYVEGSDLKSWCAAQGGIEKVSLEERLEIIAQTADALQAAHESGVVHRDVKPGNILVTRRNGEIQVKLTDFGIGQVLSEEALEGMTQGGFTLTMLGSTSTQSGTQMYMAPELLAGNKASAQSDIYSLGVVFYQMLVGNLGKPITLDWINHVKDELIAEDLKQCFWGETEDRFSKASLLSERIRSLDKRREVLAQSQAAAEARERAAYRKGLVRAGAVAMLLVGIFVTMAIFAWNRAKFAEEETERASSLAIEEAEQRKRVEEALVTMQLQRAEGLLASDESQTALAYLAQVIRDKPMNRVGGERLLSALTYRSLPLPVSEPMRHQEGVRSAQFSPGGERVVTASWDNTARVWDARTGQPLSEPMRHEERVNFAQFSPDGERVVTASQDGTARVWDSRTGQPLSEPMRHEERVNFAQFSPDGERVVTASFDKTARLWDSKTGEPLSEPIRHEGSVERTQFSPDGNRVVTASGDKTARVWDSRSGQPLSEPMRHGSVVLSAHFSPDGERVVTSSLDRTARVWDARTGEPLSEPMLHEGPVSSVQFSPNGEWVVTSSGDKTARVWDSRTGQPLSEPIGHREMVITAQFSPDGERVVTASWDNTARVWNSRTGQPLSEPMQHEDRVMSVQFSPDGGRVVTASDDNTARMWDSRSGQPMRDPMRHESHVRSAQFSPDGERVVTASRDGTAIMWDSRTGQPLSEPLRHEGFVFSAHFSPDGERVVTASGDKTARVWDSRTGQPLSEPLRHKGIVNFAQFSPDGERVVTASFDRTARVWDSRTGQPLSEPMRHQSIVWFVQFSPDGERVVTASHDRTARVWDSRTGQPLNEPMKHDGSVQSAQFSPDGKQVVTAARDGTAIVWDSRTGQPLGEPMRHQNDVFFAQFSPDGERVVTASQDKTARVWDSTTGKPVSKAMRHEESISFAQFSPDGEQVVTASDDKTARVWNSRTGQPLSEPMRHEQRVASAHFSPDGERVVTASWDKTARVWDAPSIPLPVPDWIADLAEAIAGKRIGEGESLDLVDVKKLFELRDRLQKSTATDFYTKFGKWFFADRSTRTISPYSTVTVPELKKLKEASNGSENSSDN